LIMGTPSLRYPRRLRRLDERRLAVFIVLRQTQMISKRARGRPPAGSVGAPWMGAGLWNLNHYIALCEPCTAFGNGATEIID
jgi:hypothetical protein